MAEKIETTQHRPTSMPRLRRAAAKAGLLAASFGHPSSAEIQTVIDEEAASKIVSRDLDPTTGIQVVTRGDGSRHRVEVSPDDAQRAATAQSELRRHNLEAAFSAPPATDPNIKDNQ